MKLLGEQTTLVLAGAWNPAILNPNWIGRHILGLPAGKDFQVGMLLPVQGGLAAPARLTFEGISITAGSEALLFHLAPEDAAMVKKSFEVAKRILETLPHTPILAMGVNFAYSLEAPEGELTKTVAWADHVADLIAEDPDAKVVTRMWQLGISALGHLINLTFQSNAQGTTIAANHHYEVEGSAAKAAGILGTDGLFAKLLSTTDTLVTGLIKGGAA